MCALFHRPSGTSLSSNALDSSFLTGLKEAA